MTQKEYSDERFPPIKSRISIRTDQAAVEAIQNIFLDKGYSDPVLVFRQVRDRSTNKKIWTGFAVERIKANTMPDALVVRSSGYDLFIGIKNILSKDSVEAQLNASVLVYQNERFILVEGF